MGMVASRASADWERTAGSKGSSMASPPAVMSSAPMATPMEMLPWEMELAMSAVALRPEEQKRLRE